MTLNTIPEEIKQFVSYDANTGLLTWISKPNKKTNIGSIAGHQEKPNDYIRIRFRGTMYAAHRVAWFLHTGIDTTDVIDHRNGIKTDNRFNNLRIATQSQNRCNVVARKDNTSTIKGVSWNKQANKWKAYITKDGKTHHLGYFKELDKAKRAYYDAAIQLHGEFRNTG